MTCTMDEYSQLHRGCSVLYSYLVLVLSILQLVVIPKLVSGCHEVEKEALLKFKHGGLYDPANILSSWGSGKDCCSWAGVGCNNTTRRVVKLVLRNANLDEYGQPLSNSSLGGKIDSSLIHLKHLTYLDLSFNNFSTMIHIPEFFGSFEHLEYLNLSSAKFVGRVPQQLGNLSNLHTLDLRSNSYSLTVDDFTWVSSLSSLQYLDLSWASLSYSEPNWLTNFSSLTHLYLCGTGFHGSMPHTIGNLTNLEVLDMSSNSIYGPIPASFSTNLCKLRILNLRHNTYISGWERYWTGSICLANSLQELYLDHNMLSSSTAFLSTIGNLTSLEVLDLSFNSINGTVQRSFSNLCRLRILRLQGNSIRGMEPYLEGCLSNNLEELNLGGNQLGGNLQVLWRKISSSKTLKILDLSYNSLSGYIPYSSRSIGAGTILSYVLERLNLNGNKLSGHAILQKIRKFSNLVALNISSNFFPIIITEDVLTNLERLEYIDLSNNYLVWKVKSRWLPPNIKRIILSSSQVGPKFPSWLQQHHRAISGLYMSNASISDDVPDWFWKIATDMEYLILSDNQLRGYLPNIGLSTWYGLDLSNNSLSGPIPEGFCRLEKLRKLDLSSNQFHGNIPDCWGMGAGRNLFYIDLSNNNLSGDFPHSLSDLPSLAFLHMRNNSISGEIFSTSRIMKNLVVLDLAYNKLSGVIPTWGTIGEHLPNLRILSLRSNMVHGNIPTQISKLSSLQFLDLSFNKLSGAIPSFFGNFTAMTRVHNETDREFQFLCFESGCRSIADYAWMNLKGVERENRGTLGFMNVIDLSSNNLSGDIPEELTQLHGLVSMNLSSNSLKGQIPNEIGELRQLESLDFSRNKLSGEIPSSISNLNFLSKLNLSHNNLSGKIPTGFQLQTLNDSSVYVGNVNLCGPPLLRKCSTNELPNMGKGGAKKRGKEDEFEIIGLFISIALGFVVGVWVFCGLLIFKRSWRIWYYQFVDDMIDKVVVAMAVRVVAQLKRKFNKSTEI